ncbi:hypothetical protein KKF91_15690 [Myxococcota bacterium]|nr:hypothetical protein [Myxococcota bacterium]MBU1431983.1 hypothetical protein [Myxococcota bacterium]MBU1899826.1 hypothetical protein [Myxococcota bacterium]
MPGAQAAPSSGPTQDPQRLAPDARLIAAYAAERRAIFAAQVDQPLHPHLKPLRLDALRPPKGKLITQTFSQGMRAALAAPGAVEVYLRFLMMERGPELEATLEAQAAAWGCVEGRALAAEGCALAAGGRLRAEIERPLERPSEARFTLTGRAWSIGEVAPDGLLSAPIDGLSHPACRAIGYHYGRYTFHRPQGRFDGLEHLSIVLDCAAAEAAEAALYAARRAKGWAPLKEDARVLLAPGAPRLTFTTRRAEGAREQLILHHQAQEARR